MRKKKAMINSAFSILLEIVTVVAGFILPKLFITTFGSEVNGLISSISSFIGYITLLQSGVGSVAKASMYKPLALDDHHNLCVIVKTVEKFFRKIAGITVGYIALLAILFPTVIAPESGDFLYTSSLVMIIGVSTFSQYYFGITYQMLLEADQRSYIYSIIQIATVVINTLLSVILIKLGFSIQIVKLGSAAIFMLRPFILSLYSKKKYRIENDVQADNSLIKQRWDGFAQAIAYFIHSKTDIFVLTFFARISPNISLSLVSVYSIYSLITVGISAFIKAIEKAVTPALGNIVALGHQDDLYKTFTTYYNFMHIVCTTVFATASITVFKFIGVYVKDITDAEYIQYAFGYIIIAAEYLYCMRSPYNSMIYAAGKFRETRTSAAVEAILNIVISVLFVTRYGLVGVAVGTLAAMAYRTVSFMIFLSKNVICIQFFAQVKRYLLSIGIYVGLISLGALIDIPISSMIGWVFYAGAVCIITGSITLGINFLLMKTETAAVIRTFANRAKK